MSDAEEAKRIVSAVTGSRKAVAVSATTLETLVQASIALGACKIRPYVKPGMTNQEKNDALDAALERFAKCLKKRFGG